eukprot:SAG31_NODE_892_length_11180_cov_22.596426_7_plen_115_part_00
MWVRITVLKGVSGYGLFPVRASTGARPFAALVLRQPLRSHLSHLNPILAPPPFLRPTKPHAREMEALFGPQLLTKDGLQDTATALADATAIGICAHVARAVLQCPSSFLSPCFA